MPKRKRPEKEFLEDLRPLKKRLTVSAALKRIFLEYPEGSELRMDALCNDLKSIFKINKLKTEISENNVENWSKQLIRRFTSHEAERFLRKCDGDEEKFALDDKFDISRLTLVETCVFVMKNHVGKYFTHEGVFNEVKCCKNLIHKLSKKQVFSALLHAFGRKWGNVYFGKFVMIRKENPNPSNVTKSKIKHFLYSVEDLTQRKKNDEQNEPMELSRFDACMYVLKKRIGVVHTTKEILIEINKLVQNNIIKRLFVCLTTTNIGSSVNMRTGTVVDGKYVLKRRKINDTELENYRKLFGSTCRSGRPPYFVYLLDHIPTKSETTSQRLHPPTISKSHERQFSTGSYESTTVPQKQISMNEETTEVTTQRRRRRRRKKKSSFKPIFEKRKSKLEVLEVKKKPKPFDTFNILEVIHKNEIPRVQSSTTQIIEYFDQKKKYYVCKFMKVIRNQKKKMTEINSRIKYIEKMNIYNKILVLEYYEEKYRNEEEKWFWESSMIYESFGVCGKELKKNQNKNEVESVIREICSNIIDLSSLGIEVFLKKEDVFYKTGCGNSNNVNNNKHPNGTKVKFLLSDNFRFKNLSSELSEDYVKYLKSFFVDFLEELGYGKEFPKIVSCREDMESLFGSVLFHMTVL